MTSTRSVRGLAALFAMLLICGPRHDSRAGDDPDKRRELMRQIDDKVDDLVDAIEDVPGDSSERSIDTARALAYEIKKLASDLEDVAGDDSDAKRIADRYPDDMDELARDVTTALRGLKQGQHHADPEAQQCSERDKELVRQASEFESKNDPDGLTELPRLATQYQESTKQAMEQARRDDDKLEDAEENADDYSADGGLREVDSAVSAAGRRMYADGHKSEEAAEKACENLLRGVDHPQVKDALAHLGNSAGGRKAIIEQLDKDARELASTLGRVAADSGLGTVERARGLVTEVEHGLANLGRNATTDKATKLVLDKWPEAVKQMKLALDGLEHLKQHQHDLDALPDKCKQREQDFQDAVRKNGDDTDGVEDLPKVAEELAVPVRAGLDKARERLREQERDRDLARSLTTTEGVWAEVGTAQRAATDELFRAFEDGLKKTESACENLVKGKDAPATRDAVAALQKGGASTGDQLERDVDAWVARAKATYLVDCQGMKDIWAAYCAQDWEPGDESEQRAAAREIADPIKATMQSSIAGVLADLPAVESRVKTLADKRETQKLGKTLQGKLTKEKTRLTKLQANPVLGGNYDLMLQFANNYGKQQHERMWGRFNCKVPTSSTAEAAFPPEGESYYKPDCVDPDGCKVWEFKARGPSGESEGAKQRQAYERNVPAYYNKLVNSDGTYSPAESKFGGAEIMKTLMQKCFKNGAIKLESYLEPYDPCKEQYECTTD